MAETVRKTYKYKLQPTPTQERALEDVLWRCRTLSNAGLEQRIIAWQHCHVSVSRFQQEAELKAIRAEMPCQPLPVTGQETGIDLGLESFATLADGSQMANPRIVRFAEMRLARTQRRVSRRKRGSHRRKKAVTLLAKAQQTVRRARADFHHTTALALVRQYDTISREDVQTANRVKNHHLAKSIADAGWSVFLSIPSFKAVDAG